MICWNISLWLGVGRNISMLNLVFCPGSHSSINTSMSVSFAGKIGLLEVLQILVLIVSTIYYFKTNHRQMKIISSIGFISLMLVLLIVNGLM